MVLPPFTVLREDVNVEELLSLFFHENASNPCPLRWAQMVNSSTLKRHCRPVKSSKQR